MMFFILFWALTVLEVNGTVTSLLVFIQNILNCVPKTRGACRISSEGTYGVFIFFGGGGGGGGGHM